MTGGIDIFGEYLKHLCLALLHLTSGQRARVFCCRIGNFPPRLSFDIIVNVVNICFFRFTLHHVSNYFYSLSTFFSFLLQTEHCRVLD